MKKGKYIQGQSVSWIWEERRWRQSQTKGSSHAVWHDDVQWMPPDEDSRPLTSQHPPKLIGCTLWVRPSTSSADRSVFYIYVWLEKSVWSLLSWLQLHNYLTLFLEARRYKRFRVSQGPMVLSLWNSGCRHVNNILRTDFSLKTEARSHTQASFVKITCKIKLKVAY